MVTEFSEKQYQSVFFFLDDPGRTDILKNLPFVF